MHYVMTCVVIGLVIWMWVDLSKAKKLIQDASKSALYPTNVPEIKVVRTLRGEMEPLSFESKSWKTKRRMIFFMSIFLLLMIGVTYIFDGYFTWMNLFIFLYLPFLTMHSSRIAGFVAMHNGFYFDERFFSWESVDRFETQPVKLGSEAYGMFDNSSSYTEVKMYFSKKGNKSVSIFVHEDEEEKLCQLLRERELVEMNALEKTNG